MIRILCTETDYGAAAHVGGPVVVTHKTFDIEAPEMEKWLRETLPQGSYGARFIHGVEELPKAPPVPNLDHLWHEAAKERS